MQNASSGLAGPSQSVATDANENLVPVDTTAAALPAQQEFMITSGDAEGIEAEFDALDSMLPDKSAVSAGDSGTSFNQSQTASRDSANDQGRLCHVEPAILDQSSDYDADDEDSDLDPIPRPTNRAVNLQLLSEDPSSNIIQPSRNFVLEASIGSPTRPTIASHQRAAEDGNPASSEELSWHSSDEFEGIANNTPADNDRWMNPRSLELWVVDRELNAVVQSRSQWPSKSDEEEPGRC